MRLVYKLYDGDDHALIQTDDDGQNPKVIEGELPPRAAVKRVSAYIEVSCDNRKDVVNRVRDAIKQLQDHLAVPEGA